MHKRVLIVGDANNQLISTYSLVLKKHAPRLDVDAISYRTCEKQNAFTNIFTVKVPKILSKLPKISNLFFYIIFIYIYKKKYKAYDVIHFHMAFPGVRFIIKLPTTAKKILTLWGSDFYRASKFRRQLIKIMIDNSDILTCTNPQMANDVNMYYGINKRFEVCYYSLEPLEKLSKIANANKVTDYKKAFKIETNKTIVTIGYNNNFGQQHIKIINELSKLEDITNNIFIIIPASYGGAGVENIKNIAKTLQSNGFDYKIITDYLSSTEVAHLRLITEIFIQLQITDQLSGSMIEHLFAKNIVVTGAWLPYNILKDNDVYFNSIENLSDLSLIIDKITNEIKFEMKKHQKNSENIYRIFGNSNNFNKWIELYK